MVIATLFTAQSGTVFTISVIASQERLLQQYFHLARNVVVAIFTASLKLSLQQHLQLVN